jgi:plastocyanin
MPPVAMRITITPDGRFDPPQFTVNRGDTVQWVNTGRSPRTVTADPARAQSPSNVALPAGAQPWDSGVLNASQSYTRTFDTPGTYQYVSLPDERQDTIGQLTVKS